MCSLEVMNTCTCIYDIHCCKVYVYTCSLGLSYVCGMYVVIDYVQFVQKVPGNTQNHCMTYFICLCCIIVHASLPIQLCLTVAVAYCAICEPTHAPYKESPLGLRNTHANNTNEHCKIRCIASAPRYINGCHHK